MSIFRIEAKKIAIVVLSVVISFAFVSVVVNGATTISTNIVTGGTLSVTGLSTFLGGATTTTLTLLNGEVISNATDGIIQIGGIASTTSITLLNGETITNATDGTITLGATSMVLVGTASTSAIKVGDKPDTPIISGLVSGYCTFPAASIAASTTVMFACAGATGLQANDRVFVQATSSLAGNFIVQHASTTADGTIQVDIYNTGYLNAVGTGSVTTDINSLNFWAFR